MILPEVEALLAQARAVGKRYESIIPEPIRQEHWQLAKGDPSAWESVEFKHPNTPGLDGVATLSLVIAKLDGLIKREKAQGRPVDLHLGKVRRYQE